jgi:hypothetical protein
MIFVRLIGGLGNQMFQYAAARRLAERHRTEVVLDTSWLETRDPGGATTRFYELGCFELAARITDRPAADYHVTGYVARARRRLGLLNRHLINESGPGFDAAVLDAPDRTVLNGYWQDVRYFEDAAPAIRAAFTFRGELSDANRATAESMAATDAVSLHVRRGDYVSNPTTSRFHGTCSLEYYAAAIHRVSQVVKEPHFYVFSDDPAWTKAHLRCDHPMTFVDDNPPDRGFEDMRLMSACRHHIVANSSFSWWGAWLGPNDDKIVVAPRTWFRDPVANAAQELPASWVRLEAAAVVDRRVTRRAPPR